jgi:hypothetical protein
MKANKTKEQMSMKKIMGVIRRYIKEMKTAKCRRNTRNKERNKKRVQNRRSIKRTKQTKKKK